MEYRLAARHGGRSLSFLHNARNRQEAVSWAKLKSEQLALKLSDVRLLEKQHDGFRGAWVEVWRR